MIENILKFFIKQPQKQKLDNETYIQYTRRDPETQKLEQRHLKQQGQPTPEYSDWKRMKYKSYDVKKLLAQSMAMNNSDSFIDPQFPHTNASISDQQPEIIFQWRRIPQIIKYPIYSSSQSYQTFQRISLSNKKLKEALVFIYRTHPTKFKQLLAHSCNADGLYEFKLYNHGIIQNVVIDDFVPVVNGVHPLMMGPIGDREIFGMLLEKAVAKVCGGYEKIPEGLDQLLEILFCGPLRKTKIDQLTNVEVVAKTVENTMLNSGVAGFISKNQPKIRSFGISENELYHIIGKFSVNIKNQPNTELYQLISQKKLAAWNGKFSHNDSQWQKLAAPERNELFKRLNKNKSFFISNTDIPRIFDHLIAFDGTDINNKQWIELESQVLYPSFAIFELRRNDQVFVRVTARDPIRTSVILVEDCGQGQGQGQGQRLRYVTGVFHENSYMVEFTASLRPGRYVICTHHDWILNRQGNYSIFMSSDSHTSLHKPKQGIYPNFLQNLFKQLSEHSKALNPVPSFLTLKRCYTIGMLAKETGFAFVDFSIRKTNQKEAFIQINPKVLAHEGWEIIEPNSGRKSIQLTKGDQEQIMLILKTHKYLSQQNVHFPSTAFNLKV